MNVMLTIFGSWQLVCFYYIFTTFTTVGYGKKLGPWASVDPSVFTDSWNHSVKVIYSPRRKEKGWVDDAKL